MSARFKTITSRWQSSALALLLLAVLPATAAPVRVTTWSLEAKVGATNDVIPDAATALKKLNPDVILLQRVPDWQSCNELAAALKPANYRVAICSSFRDARTGKLSREQTAILSKAPAYISWAEAWQGGGQDAVAGGFAFAAIHVGNKNVAFFCVEPDSGARGDVSAQLLKHVGLLQDWTVNKVQGLLVAGNFGAGEVTNLPGQLAAAGFADALAALPEHGGLPEATSDYVFVREAGRALSATAAPESALAHSPVTVELDLNAAPVAAPVKTAVAQKSPPVPPAITNRVAESAPAAAPAIVPTTVSTNTWWLAGGALGALLLLAVVWRTARRPVARRAVLAPMKSGRAMENSPAFPRGQVVVKQQPLTTATSGAATNADRPTVINIDAAGATQTQSEHWQQRAQAAERRAEEATTALQTGLLPHLSRWLKEKFVHRLASDRAQLLETQRVAALKMLAVDERLAKVETELKQRYRVYERRIDELLKELAVAKEENRELIRAKIALVKAEMEKERARAEQTRAD
jgi:hypothetical protein